MEKLTHYYYFELFDMKFDKEFDKRFDCPFSPLLASVRSGH